ncbi:MAG TPA: DUF3313 family protein [Rhizomicrobium sp.]|nr:DUF3313 family protein [Rhizomicrobium sp.]
MRPRKFIDDGLFLVSFTVALGVASMIIPARGQDNPSAQPTQAPAMDQPQTPAVQAPQTPADMGLVRTTDTRFRIAYTKPGTDWSRFKTINLHALAVPPDAADAAPASARTRGRESFILGDREISSLQDAFAQAMRSTLSGAGYTFVDTPQADTLVIAPTVQDITLSAPIERTRMSGRTRTYTQGGGSISVAAVFADGGTGEVIGTAAATNRPSNIWRINNRVTNMADARNAFNEWARALRDTLQGRYSGR